MLTASSEDNRRMTGKDELIGKVIETYVLTAKHSKSARHVVWRKVSNGRGP